MAREALTDDVRDRLTAKREDTDPEVILANLVKWAQDGDSPEPEAILMAEAALVLDSTLSDEEGLVRLVEQQSRLLTAAVNALRGPPPPLTTWSHHDVEELALKVVDERNQLSAVIEELQIVLERTGYWHVKDTLFAILKGAPEGVLTVSELMGQAWEVGVATALNYAVRQPDSITLRLETRDGEGWVNPYTRKRHLIEGQPVELELEQRLRELLDTKVNGLTWWEWIKDGLGGSLHDDLKKMIGPAAS
jgi:hypothetical protein